MSAEPAQSDGSSGNCDVRDRLGVHDCEGKEDENDDENSEGEGESEGEENEDDDAMLRTLGGGGKWIMECSDPPLLSNGFPSCLAQRLPTCRADLRPGAAASRAIVPRACLLPNPGH